MDLEMIAMELVGNAGESRSLSFEALSLAREGNFDEAEEKLKEAKQSMLRAHEIQTQLICKEADGEEIKIGILMVHAQDHLMCSILARELVEELIKIYKKI
ncbi:MAG: PTS lactose/cellobiose transporter subunit IIA [Fusobacteriaceae bacterium]|nr:PTS lactose/cellobiose transporter subunit IIA [Fusobacteriaceae bacterium]